MRILSNSINSTNSIEFNELKGFSLIELMIVIAIIGILAAIAVPAYNTYVVKSRVAEMIALTRGPQLAIQEYVAVTGQTGAITGVTAATVPAIATLPPVPCGAPAMTVSAAGVIVVAPGTCQGGTTITMTPTITGSTLTWTCTSGPAASQQFAPNNCR